MPFVMVTGNSIPVENTQDIIEIAKANPGKLTCTSAGIGTTDHLLCELLQREAGIDILHVPYRGSAPALTDVIGGQVDMLITPLPTALPHITAGSLRAIAVMSSWRASVIPHVPTIGQHGYPGAYGESWFGLVAPTGTPPQVIARLNHSINAVWADPALQESMAQLAFAAAQQPNTSMTCGKFLAAETERWTEVLRQRKIQARH
jgi:tripartite-type tricarboxylate transporter receptor subunit TctC